MNIITRFGIVDEDLISQAEGKLKVFLEKAVESCEIFFLDENDVTDSMSDKLSEDLFDLIADNNFSEPERVLALLHVADAEIGDIEESDYGENKIFEIGEEEWMVLTDDEADEATVESVENTLDDISIFGMPQNIIDAILAEDDLIDTEWFLSYMDDDNRYLVDEY